MPGLRLAPHLSKPVFLAFLRLLSREKAIAINGAWLRLATHVVHLTPHDEGIWLPVMPLIGGEERFRPPRVRDICVELGLAEERRHCVLRESLRAARRASKLTVKSAVGQEISSPMSEHSQVKLQNFSFAASL